MDRNLHILSGTCSSLPSDVLSDIPRLAGLGKTKFVMAILPACANTSTEEKSTKICRRSASPLRFNGATVLDGNNLLKCTPAHLERSTKSSRLTASNPTSVSSSCPCSKLHTISFAEPGRTAASISKVWLRYGQAASLRFRSVTLEPLY